MEPQIIGIPTEVYRRAIKVLLELEDFQLLVMTFGIIVVILFSLIAIWKHIEEGRI